MKYVLMFVGADWDSTGAISEEEKKVYGRIGEWFGEHRRAGRIVGGEELKSVRSSTTVRFQNGRPVVTDGPFVEAKEVVGGFAIINVPDLDAAIALAKTWPGRSSVEIRPVIDHTDDMAQAQAAGRADPSRERQR